MCVCVCVCVLMLTCMCNPVGGQRLVSSVFLNCILPCFFANSVIGCYTGWPLSPKIPSVSASSCWVNTYECCSWLFPWVVCSQLWSSCSLASTSPADLQCCFKSALTSQKTRPEPSTSRTSLSRRNPVTAANPLLLSLSTVFSVRP